MRSETRLLLDVRNVQLCYINRRPANWNCHANYSGYQWAGNRASFDHHVTILPFNINVIIAFPNKLFTPASGYNLEKFLVWLFDERGTFTHIRIFFHFSHLHYTHFYVFISSPVIVSAFSSGIFFFWESLSFFFFLFISQLFLSFNTACSRSSQKNSLLVASP